MHLSEFLLHFQQPWRAGQAHDYGLPQKTRQAAVLIAMHPKQDGLHVILTQRAMHLAHHAGEVSFPGGKHEPEDPSLYATALREAEEEIGLSTSQVSILGSLPPYSTISGFSVTPVLAYVDRTLDLTTDLVPDPNEVADIFDVPLSFLMEPVHYHSYTVSRKHIKQPVYFVPYQGKQIWGATAGMLKLLSQQIR